MYDWRVLEYGAQINPEKTLVNFKPKDQTIQHVLLEPNGIMPYIGIGIKMDKLELLRNMNASVETTFFKEYLKKKLFSKDHEDRLMMHLKNISRQRQSWLW